MIAATIAVETERVAPGHIVHRSPFARLNVSSAGRTLLGGTLDQLQKMGFECRFIDDEPTLMWSKLVFLAPFALTTTAADKTSGEILADPDWREVRVLRVAKPARWPWPKARKSMPEVDPRRGEDGAGKYAQLHAERCRARQCRRNSTRSLDQFCAARRGTGLRCRRRRSWWRRWSDERVILSAAASSRREDAAESKDPCSSAADRELARLSRLQDLQPRCFAFAKQLLRSG